MAAQAKDDDDDEDRTAPGVQSGRALGFHARLAGVGLWDLVQMECLAGSRACVRVVGEGGVGYLYFAQRNIVHAVTAHATGEAAALEILSWTNGSFQPCDRPWPEAATIATSHEALILQVAKRRDESSNLVAFPGRGAGDATAGSDVEVLEIEEEGAVDMRRPDEREVPPAQPVARAETPGGDFSVMLRLSPRGEIMKNIGGSEQLAETAAYVRRLTELAGELMGIGGFAALECTFADGRLITFIESNGDAVVLRPRPEANLQALRERLGL